MPDPTPGLVPRQTLDFTASGRAGRPATEGVCAPESHHSWALAPVCRVNVPPCPGAETLYLLIEITPFCRGTGWPALKLVIDADGEPCATLCTERATVLAVRIASPRQIADGFTLSFVCPEAPHPNPSQKNEQPHLAFALHRIRVFEPAPPQTETASRHSARFTATPPGALCDAIRQELGLGAEDLLMRFESLGHNCDFGFAQRQGGADPLGLLRYAGAEPHDLARAILLGFDGMGEDLKIYASPCAEEYLITDMRYAIHSHTSVSPGAADPDTIRRAARRRLGLLARKFMEEVRRGEKIFLLRHPADDASNGMLTLWVALNLYARNSILNVMQEPEWRPRGVTEIGPRQMIGTIDGSIGVRPPSLAAWLYVCAEAYLLK